VVKTGKSKQQEVHGPEVLAGASRDEEKSFREEKGREGGKTDTVLKTDLTEGKDGCRGPKGVHGKWKRDTKKTRGAVFM